MIQQTLGGILYFGGTPLQGVTPASGQIAMSDINGAFGWGNDLNAYRGRQWFTPQGQSGTFPTGQIAFSDFYNKQPNNPVTPGSLDYTQPGYYEFNVPNFNYFRVQVWGGGAGGGAGQGKNQPGTDGAAGGNSTVLGVTGGGGGGGGNGPGYRTKGAGGPGGGASGGNEANEAGGAGQIGTTAGGVGGNGARGGGGGAGGPPYNNSGGAGGFPGGGGGGGDFDDLRGGWVLGGGGGGGGYAQTIWYPGQIAVGTRVGVTVASGGGGGGAPYGGGAGGPGAQGRVLVSWG